jgi:hypothetical protein
LIVKNHSDREERHRIQSNQVLQIKVVFTNLTDSDEA